MLNDENYTDLSVKGYTVVANVLTKEECDQTVDQYKEWLSQFKDCVWPFPVHSLVKNYNAGNMHPTWFVRLKAKNIFAQVWKTDKLLSSIDAVVIGRPPETTNGQFSEPSNHWLHLDQSPSRDGLHAYQGVVYLETADEDDWTFHVLEGSHIHFKEFYEKIARPREETRLREHYVFTNEEVQFMENKGCKSKRVPVPKGGMVLWDSRLVHANAYPIKGRVNSGRWRFGVLVCMAPAIWASEEDMQKRKEVYDKAGMTTHWPSQGVKFLEISIAPFAPSDIVYPTQLPEIAKSPEAKLICGVLQYDFNDGRPNGEELKPTWKKHALINGDHVMINKKTLLSYGIVT